MVQPNESAAFISYSFTDQEYVNRLIDHLDSMGIATRSDRHMRSGEPLSTEITRNIDRTSAVIVVMTPSSEQSRWVQAEVQRALDLRKPVFSLLLIGERPFFRLAIDLWEDVRGGTMPRESFLESLRLRLPMDALPNGGGSRATSKVQRSSTRPVARQPGSSELEAMLVARDWRSADRITSAMILQMGAKRQPSGPQREALTTDELQRLDCAGLRGIDTLWRDHSNGHYGTGPQARILRGLDAAPGTYAHKNALGEALGWRDHKSWLRRYEHLTFDLSSPIGHLPTYRNPGLDDQSSWAETWSQQAIGLIERFDQCVRSPSQTPTTKPRQERGLR